MFSLEYLTRVIEHQIVFFPLTFDFCFIFFFLFIENMLNFFLTWKKGSEYIFTSSLNIKSGKSIHTLKYIWPDTVTIEFFLGIRLFLEVSCIPVDAKVMRKYKRTETTKQSLCKMLKQHILSERNNYVERGYEFEDFLSSRDLDVPNTSRKMDREILDFSSFCNKYVRDNIKFGVIPIRMQYIADVSRKFCTSFSKPNVKKIQFNSIDLLKGFLSLNECTKWHYHVKVGHIYRDFKLCKLVVSHPNLFYSISTVKQLLLETIPEFYNELCDLIVSFFSFCASPVNVESIHTITCQNLALEHLENQCYICRGKEEMENVNSSQQIKVLSMNIKILPFD